MTEDPRSLVVFGFDQELKASEMLTSLTRLSSEGSLLLLDAVFVTRTDKGKVRVVPTTDPTPGQAAWGGAFWGLLFGALLFVPVIGMAIGAGASALSAKLIDTGIPDSFVKDLRSAIVPGKTYLAVLVSHVNGEKALEEMKRWSGMAEVITANLSAEQTDRLKDALGQHEYTEGVSEDESTLSE